MRGSGAACIAGRCGRVEFFFKKVWGAWYAVRGVSGGFFNHGVLGGKNLTTEYTEGRGTELHEVLIK